MEIILPAVEEGRFARLEAIEWWNMSLMREARVLVVGAGALGNEVIKNLALLGVGHLLVVDMDNVELSNLSRSCLYRASDEGKPKAECAARAARDIYPEMDARAFTGSVLSDLGLGYFRWAQVVIGAVDNREARVFINSACARTGRPWIDGGIEVLHGIARGFAPPTTACYECTMSEKDWDLVNQRRSCSLLARRAIAQRGTPTTPTTASVIGAIQAQEAVKLIHGLSALVGRGFIFDGANHDSYSTSYPINPDCVWHEEATPIESIDGFHQETPLAFLRDWAVKKLGGLDAIDLGRELVQSLDCPSCGTHEEILSPIEHVTPERVPCPACGMERIPTFFHSIPADSPLLSRSARQLGLPGRDVIWPRFGSQSPGIEIAATP
jgi:adenylyltransferase/sulfurtransferase